MTTPGTDIVEAIRRRPGMYVGSSGARGIEHLVREVLGNAVDLALTGAVTELRVRVHPDGALTVTDDGPGIDVTPDADGVPFLTRVLTTWRDTPTADGHHPHVHLTAAGMGLHLVCAVSDRVEIVTTRGAQTWRQTFAAGRVCTALERLDAPGPAGTTITFRPDPEIFDPPGRIDLSALDHVLRDLAALVPGLTTSLEVGEREWPPGAPAHLLPDPSRRAWELRTADDGDTLVIAFAVTRRDPVEPVRGRWLVNLRELHETAKLVETLAEAFDAVLGRGDHGGLEVVVSAMLTSPTFSGPSRGRCDEPRLLDLIHRVVEDGLPGLLSSDPELRTALLG